MTVSPLDHPASPDDPLASQRVELLGQIVGAQFDLERAIADISRSGGDMAQAIGQLQSLSQLQRQIGTATPAALATLRSEVIAAVAQTQAVTQQSRAVAIAGESTAALADLAQASRKQAASVMHDLRRYDDLLQFDTAEQQDAYRQREDERRKRYDAETAKGTPEGDLSASGAALGQTTDLIVHGGSADPALVQRSADLAASTAKLRAKIAQEGGDVSKFDADLRDDLRSIMHSKGMSNERIDALLAQHENDPIKAMAALATGHQTDLSQRDIDQMAARFAYSKNINVAPISEIVANTTAPVTSMDDAMQALRASGVVVGPQELDVTPAHGVSTQVASLSASSRTV